MKTIKNIFTQTSYQRLNQLSNNSTLTVKNISPKEISGIAYSEGFNW